MNLHFKEKNTCNYFNKSECFSCARLSQHSRLPELPQALMTLEAQILPWVMAPNAFSLRAKARFSVSGTQTNPIIGILDKDLQGVELLSCPLHRNIINQAVSLIPKLLVKYEVLPYQIQTRKGELKSIIFQTNSFEDVLRVRFICKSRESENSLRKLSEELQAIIETFYKNKKTFFSSLNIQPIPHQIPEGDLEIVLHNDGYIREVYSGINVFFPAKAFMQVTPEVAEKLYVSASNMISQFSNPNVLDLFCGVGGFSLTCAGNARQVIGVEISDEAVEAANYAATINNFDNLKFYKADLLELESIITDHKPDILICNPPRRGLGEHLKADILKALPSAIIYSSCNYRSFAQDFHDLSQYYKIVTIQPFEMFPLTNHFELLAFCLRK